MTQEIVDKIYMFIGFVGWPLMIGFALASIIFGRRR